MDVAGDRVCNFLTKAFLLLVYNSKLKFMLLNITLVTTATYNEQE